MSESNYTKLTTLLTATARDGGGRLTISDLNGVALVVIVAPTEAEQAR